MQLNICSKELGVLIVVKDISSFFHPSSIFLHSVFLLKIRKNIPAFFKVS